MHLCYNFLNHIKVLLKVSFTKGMLYIYLQFLESSKRAKYRTVGESDAMINFFDLHTHTYVYIRLSYLNIILRRYLIPPDAPVFSVLVFGRVHAPSQYLL